MPENRKFNRKQRRQLTKELANLDQEGKATLLTGMIAEANRKALNDVAPRLMIAGMGEAYSFLYTKYVSTWDSEEDEERKAQIVEEMFSTIRVQHLKHAIEKDKMEQKQKELAELRKEEQAND